MSLSYHQELHVIQRSGWLRAAVLGANDGIISVTSLIMGMAASGASSQTLLVTCIAGLISGATSMAAGEYISVKSQEDIEKSDLKFEATELENNPHAELKELTEIYISRGLKPELAHEVATQLTEHDALGHMPVMKLAYMKILLRIRFKQRSLLLLPFHVVLYFLCLPFYSAQVHGSLAQF